MKGPEKQYQLDGWFLACFWFSQFAASRDLTGELSGRATGQSSVRTTNIVFQSPCFDDLFGVRQRCELKGPEKSIFDAVDAFRNSRRWLWRPKDDESQHACLPGRFSHLSGIVFIFALGENLEMKVDLHFQQVMLN